MIHKYKVLESTNKYVKDNIRTFTSYDVIVCEDQTSGYGVSGMWEGSVGNLFYTIVLDNFIVELKKLPFMILNSMFKVINEYVENVHIKLPNDLYIDDKKIGGFIIEQKDDKYIIGIGMNINSSIDGHIALKDIYSQEIDIDEVIDNLTRNIMLEVINTDSEIIRYFNENVGIIGKSVCYQDKLTKLEYEDLCLSIDFDNVYFKNHTINIEKFSKCGKNEKI
jgi:biotin-[acetyl-CoA-carboxylase] ligase BirA-like protein